MIFLGGGGSETDEARLWDEVFVSGRRLVVWPHAMPRESWSRTEQWFRQALAPRGEFVISNDGPLAEADVLVIPGGNTYDLLAAVRSRLAELPAFLQRGGHVYGGSAGAILLGVDIDIAGILDPNDIGLTDTTGANLLADHVVYPHYTDDQEQAAAGWAATHNVSVLAIPETSGVIIDSATARNAGPATARNAGPATARSAGPVTTRSAGPVTTRNAGPATARNAGPATVHVFTPTARRSYQPGASWPLTTR